MADISELLKEHRPNLSDSSLKTYNSFLRGVYKNVSGDVDVPDAETLHDYYIENVNDVLAFLSKLNLSQRKTRLAAIVVFVQDDEDIAKQYRTELNNDSQKYEHEIKNQTKSESQKQNWLTQDEIRERYLQLEREAKPLLNKKSLDMHDLQQIQNFIIISLYHLNEPRRLVDYTKMKIKNIDKEKDNYIDKGFFVFNSYKTAKYYGSQRIAISNKLKVLLRKWIKLNPTDHLLFDTHFNALTPVQLTQRLNKIFGKKASINILRHSYLSEKYKDIPALKELEETAKNLGHSLSESLQYVKRDD